MSYSDKLDVLKKVRAKYSTAKAEHAELVSRQGSIDADVQQAYQEYIKKSADALTGDTSSKQAKDAEKQYLSLQEERDKLDKDIDVSERVLSVIEVNFREAESDFRRHATAHHKTKLKPHFDTIQEALDTVNSEIDQLNAYRMELQKDQVPESVLKGIKHHSRAVITTKNNGSLGMREFITKL